MASDSNIKKVTLEIGGEILRTKEWTEIDGYFETTEVGTGVWSVTYSTTKCFDGNLRGIPDWVFDENDDRYPDVKNALEDLRCGDQRNTAPYFNLPHTEDKGHPNYVGFKIIDIQTIGQSQDNELSEGNYINDADGGLSSLSLNNNSFTSNTDISDMRTYQNGNPIWDSLNPQNTVYETWEFKPGGFSPLLGQLALGIEYLMPAWPGGGKTIWKFTCEKASGVEANFRSASPRGRWEFCEGCWGYQGIDSGMGDNSTDNAYNPQWDNYWSISTNLTIPIINENISSGAYGALHNPWPGCDFHDYDTPYDPDSTPERFRRGYESVQGRTLYLYPTANSPYKHPIIFDIFEGVQDAIWVRGSSKGIIKFVADLVKRQAYEDEGVNFDNDFSGYTVDMEALNWSIPLDGILPYTFSGDLADYWPNGVDFSIQGFFSTYKCYISPYVHSGLWSYNQQTLLNGDTIGNGGIVYEENPGDIAEQTGNGADNPLATTGGIIGLNQDISPVHAIGSSIIPVDWDYYMEQINDSQYTSSYPFNPGAVVGPTYNQYRRLGWRSACFDSYWGDYKWGVAGDWAEESGFALEMRISELENCEVWILTDYFTEQEKNALESLSTYIETWPFSSEPVTNAVPFSSLVSESEGDNTMYSGYATTSQGGEGRDLMVGRRITSIGQTLTCMPRAYSPFTENSGSNVGKGGMIMSSGLMKRHWKEIMTVTASNWYLTAGEGYADCIYDDDTSIDCTEVWVDTVMWIFNDFFQPYIEYHYDDHAPASHWEFIHIQPIDPSLPVRCEIGSFKVYKHNWETLQQSEEETELVTEFIVTSVVEEVQNQIRETWEQLDILDNKGVPLSLTFQSGDLRDVTKRSAGFSKTFEIPANPHNERVIGMLSGPGRYRDGESVKWRKGRIKSGDVEVFNGYVRIEGYKTAKGGLYKCHIIEDPAAWPTMIGDGTICELSDSEEGGIRFVDKTAENVLLPFGNGMDGSMPGVFTGSGLASEYQILDGLNPAQDRSYYKFPPINYGPWYSNGSNLLTQSLHPALSVRYLLNKIFKSIGYTLESKWMDEPQEQYNGDAPAWVGNHSTMSRLVLPYTSGTDYSDSDDSTGPDGKYYAFAGRSEKFFLDNHFMAGYPSTGIPMSCDEFDWGSSFPGFIEETDPMDCYNESPDPPEYSESGTTNTGNGYGNFSDSTINGGYTVPFTGRYRVAFKGWFSWIKNDVLDSCMNGPTLYASWHVKDGPGQPYYPLTAATGSEIVGGLLQSQNPSVVNQYWTGGYQSYECNDEFFQEGTTPGFPWNVTQTYDWFIDASNQVNSHIGAKVKWDGNNGIFTGCGSGDWEVEKAINCEMDIDLQEGQTIKMGFYMRNINCSSAVACTARNCELMFYPLATTAEPENPVSFSTALGCNVKQMDIIKGVTEMFNLHWTVDSDSKTVYAEPYDEFYGSGKILDWSSKLDMDSWEDVYIIDEVAKEVFFRYASDNGDGLNHDFEEVESNDPLWCKRFYNEAIFNKVDLDEKGTDVFSSTFQFQQSLSSSGDLTWPCGGTPDMPILWKNEENSAGNKPNVSWQDGTERPDDDNSDSNFDLRILAYFGNDPSADLTAQSASQTINLGSFPYFGTQNMRVSPNVDYHNLSWDSREADSVINPGTMNTSLGLFDKHWKRQYEKTTGEGSLRICYFNLQDEDIELFDYRDVIKLYFDHVATYWTVNKIKDYKPGANVLTKVELVSYDLNNEQLQKPISIYGKKGISSTKKPIKRKYRKNKVKEDVNKYNLNKEKIYAQGEKNLITFNGVNENMLKKEDGSYKNIGPTHILKQPKSIVSINPKSGEVILNGGTIQASMDIDGTSVISDVYYYDWRTKKNCKLYLK